MSKSHRPIALLLLLFLLASAAIPVAFNSNSVVGISLIDTPHAPSATNYVVTVRVFNYQQAFNDDDFQFRVLNDTVPLNSANVSLYNATDMTLKVSKLTDGNGYASFYNVPQGTYKWNVSHQLDTVTPDKTGQIISNGPEANINILFGNIDWDNDQDDLNATIRDIENNLANNLNFSIHFIGNDSIYAQTEVTDGRADFEDIPDGTYLWRLSVLTDPIYAGYLLDWGTVVSNGTQLLVYTNLGPILGDPDLYDLELFTHYETSLEPIIGAVVNLMYKNGSLIDTRITPANGTVVFKDLPIAFINWTVSYGGQPVGLGNYSYDLTSVSSDVRKPVVIGPGNQSILIDAKNVTITWHLEDEYPSSIKVYVNNKLNVTQSWVNTTYDYSYNVSSSFHEFIIGHYEIKLVAYDQNGNFKDNITILRIYENITPVIEGPDPIEFFFTERGKSLSWNVTDDYVSKYRITDNDTDFASGDIDSDIPVITITLDGLQIGVHNFTFYANDTSGNTATHSVLVTVLRDSTPPVIVYTPPDLTYAQGDKVPVKNWTATDDFKSYYTISVGDELRVNVTWTTDNIEFDFSGLPEGSHVVILKVYDIGGNYAESQVTVVVTQSTVSRYLIYGTLFAIGAIVLFAVIWFVRYR